MSRLGSNPLSSPPVKTGWPEPDTCDICEEAALQYHQAQQILMKAALNKHQFRVDHKLGKHKRLETSDGTQP